MKILITVATGFIGQHLLEELKEDDFSIRIIMRNDSPKFWCSNRNFETFIADISDKTSLGKAFQDVDVVVNLAAELHDKNKFYSTNIIGVQNIINLSAIHNIKKIIHLSSTGVVGMQYSNKKVIVDENSPCNPKNEYELTKLQSELLLKEFWEKSDKKIIILRPTHVFGDHHPQKYLLEFFQRVKSEIAIPRCKNTTENYVYVKDVANAIRFFIKNDTSSMVVTIGETI
jgi:nucleoside-diphosphate-sugar epimerase